MRRWWDDVCRLGEGDRFTHALGQFVRQLVHVPASMARGTIVAIQSITPQHLSARRAIHLAQLRRRILDDTVGWSGLPPGTKGDESLAGEGSHGMPPAANPTTFRRRLLRGIRRAAAG
jgi:hypothetical protein